MKLVMAPLKVLKNFHFKLFLYSQSAISFTFHFFELLVVSKSCSFSAQNFFFQQIKKILYHGLGFFKFICKPNSLGQIYYKGLLFVLSSEMHGLYTYWRKGETWLSKLNILKKHVEQKNRIVFMLVLLMGTSILITYTCQK
jgi:hypothetical protein